MTTYSPNHPRAVFLHDLRIGGIEWTCTCDGIGLESRIVFLSLASMSIKGQSLTSHKRPRFPKNTPFWTIGQLIIVCGCPAVKVCQVTYHSTSPNGCMAGYNDSMRVFINLNHINWLSSCLIKSKLLWLQSWTHIRVPIPKRRSPNPIKKAFILLIHLYGVA